MFLLRTGILHVPAHDEAAGDAVTEVLRSSGARVHLMLESSAGDDRHWIADLLRRWSDEEELDLIVTIGATLPAPGPSGREIVPDATSDVIERDLPGLAETMRAYAQEELPLASLHRGVAGIRGRTLILNLPQGAGPRLSLPGGGGRPHCAGDCASAPISGSAGIGETPGR